MKYTHLDLVQNILSAMNSDEVNNWNDSVESRQVAQVIRDTYYEIVARADLPEHYRFFSLDDSLDTSKPVLLYKPANVARMEWLDYNISHVGAPFPPSLGPPVEYRRMKFYDIDTFFSRSDGLNEFDDDVDAMVIDNKTFKYYNNRPPTSYTVVQDAQVIFDSFDNTVETTLHATKVRAYGRIIPVYTFSNTFVPDIDDDHFIILLNEAKDRAFQEIKQTANPKSQLEARRGWRTLQRTKEFKRPHALDQFADYGRRRP